jgi:hypothetical protein
MSGTLPYASQSTSAGQLRIVEVRRAFVKPERHRQPGISAGRHCTALQQMIESIIVVSRTCKEIRAGLDYTYAKQMLTCASFGTTHLCQAE